MATRQILTVLALAVLVAGCTGGGGSSANSSATGTPPRSAGPSGSPSPSALPTTEQIPGKPLMAKDGTRLGACRDVQCEVIVGPGDVLTLDRKLRMRPVRVLSISKGRLTLDIAGTIVDFGTGGVAGTSKVDMRVTAFRGHRAVLYISRA